MQAVYRLKDPDKVYMVYDLTEDQVKLCPYDVDSKNAGARRSTVNKDKFWKIYGPFYD